MGEIAGRQTADFPCQSSEDVANNSASMGNILSGPEEQTEAVELQEVVVPEPSEFDKTPTAAQAEASVPSAPPREASPPTQEEATWLRDAQKRAAGLVARRISPRRGYSADHTTGSIWDNSGYCHCWTKCFRCGRGRSPLLTAGIIVVLVASGIIIGE